ncbi:glycosyltransferase family 4 protein [Luteolibacter ambystomatis]|uniref:Glycosyltransferase family 4 protein n=1 Tax=Luteolibacter ambystomatis TaxID=2824561 RepID=A0A975IY69_9BACT|nr:glycosyltransferase family 4 protein [Luteolibacter ambystomatis]QUE49922.1 glycosyltransferase family 4 protein [Luteolibacter ambystomatis]
MPVAFIDPPEGHPPSATPVSADAVTLNLGDWQISPTLPGRRVVSYVPWETSRIPWPVRRKLQRLDHILVLSEWQRGLFVRNGIAAEKLSVVPLGFDPEVFRPGPRQRPADAPFRFLFIGKWEARKALPELLEAFCAEFGPEERVELVLHAHNPFIDGFDQEARLRKELKKLKAENRNILCRGDLPLPELVRAYRDADAFVLPTRAEGWGLPLLEAMACGLPCITTNYSALTTFAHAGNALLVDVADFIRVRDPFFFNGWLNWGTWAKPDVSHLRRLMRQVVEQPEKAAALGRSAAHEVVDKWTWDHAATVAMERLATLR